MRVGCTNFTSYVEVFEIPFENGIGLIDSSSEFVAQKHVHSSGLGGILHG